MPALEHLTSVDRDLIAASYRAVNRDLIAAFCLAVRDLSWPADLPRPSDADLNACDLLAGGYPCGRCGVDPAQHIPEITVEQAQAANAANPDRLFPIRPRMAQTFPERSACYCDHPGAMCPVYEAMLSRWPLQAALRVAYDRVSGLLPAELQPLVTARWIDREKVLEALGGEDEAKPTEHKTLSWVLLTKTRQNSTPTPYILLSYGDLSVEIVGERRVQVFRTVADAEGEHVSWKTFAASDLAAVARERNVGGLTKRNGRRQLTARDDWGMDDGDEFPGLDVPGVDRYRNAAADIKKLIDKFPPSVCEWINRDGGARFIVTASTRAHT